MLSVAARTVGGAGLPGAVAVTPEAVFRKCRRSSARSRRGGVTLGGSLRQRLQADPLELARDRIVDLARRSGLGMDDLLHDLLLRAAPERPAAAEQLVEHDADAEDVRAAVEPDGPRPGLAPGSYTPSCRRAGSPCRGPRPSAPGRSRPSEGTPSPSSRMFAGLMSRWNRSWVWV